MGYKAVVAVNSRAIGKKSNAVDRPSPCCDRQQGVMQAVYKNVFTILPEAAQRPVRDGMQGAVCSQ